MADKVLPLQVSAILSQISILTAEYRKYLLSQIAKPEIKCWIDDPERPKGMFSVEIIEPTKEPILFYGTVKHILYDGDMEGVLHLDAKGRTDTCLIRMYNGNCQVYYSGYPLGHILGKVSTLDLLAKIRELAMAIEDGNKVWVESIDKFSALFRDK